MGVHWPVVLNDVDAFGIGITPAQGLIKGDEEVDRYLAGPAMENPSGVCIQYPEDTGHRVGARAPHGTGLYRSTLGGIGIYDGRLPFYADFVKVNSDDAFRLGLCRRYRCCDIDQFGAVVGIGTADRSPCPLPDDPGAPQNGMYPCLR